MRILERCSNIHSLRLRLGGRWRRTSEIRTGSLGVSTSRRFSKVVRHIAAFSHGVISLNFLRDLACTIFSLFETAKTMPSGRLARLRIDHFLSREKIKAFALLVNARCAQ